MQRIQMPIPRNETDDAVLNDSSSLYFTSLKEPGWIDMSAALTALAAKFSANQRSGLRSILKSATFGTNAENDQRKPLTSRMCSFDFPPCKSHD